ncbi:MAG: ISAs1 family transposase [Planctomycetes bacterium]|nr:ISAs1 family transposase [Planctomycetota bacterium]
MALSLVERLAELTDRRDRRGRQYPMAGLRPLCLVAVLAGRTTPEARAPFGQLRQKRLGHALGFRSGKRPCANTIAGLLREPDADRLDRIIGARPTDRHPDGWEHLALDGKRLCGSREGEVPGTHRLAAYAPRASAVIAQMAVEATTNEHKAALRLLDVLPALGGVVVTADAMFTHADVCAAAQQEPGDYILYAKKNRVQLRAELADTFAAAEGGAFSPGFQRQWDERGDGDEQGPRAPGAAGDHHDDVA